MISPSEALKSNETQVGKNGDFCTFCRNISVTLKTCHILLVTTDMYIIAFYCATRIHRIMPSHDVCLFVLVSDPREGNPRARPSQKYFYKPHTTVCLQKPDRYNFLSFLFGVARAPFACQHWGLPHRLAQCATPGRDLCSVARHHQANLMVCVVCSCWATSHYGEVSRAKGGIGSGELLCHDIYPARHINTVYLAANTHCMMDGHSSCAPRTVGPRVKFSSACEQSHWWPTSRTAWGLLLSVVQAATNNERL